MNAAGRFIHPLGIAAIAILAALGPAEFARAEVDRDALPQPSAWPARAAMPDDGSGRVFMPEDGPGQVSMQDDGPGRVFMLDDGPGTDTLYQAGPSARKAFFMSLLLPGAGHRYVNGGHWSGKATAFAGVDAVLWLRLIGAIWRESDLEESYTTFAGLHSGAQVEGKGRPFFVQLGGYDSSAEYVEFLLRARAWNRIDEASSPENGWDWDSEESRLRYRSLRQDTDKMERRQTWMMAALVANRFVSALSALRFAHSHKSRGTLVEVRFLPVAAGDGMAAQVLLRW